MPKDQSTSNAGAAGGIGFTGLLTIAFIVLKLCGVIAWPWVWVVSPIWIPIGILVAYAMVLFLIWAFYVFVLRK